MELPKRAIRYVSALNRFETARAYVREAELEGEVPVLSDVVSIAVEQMSVDELEVAREMFAAQLNDADFSVLREMLEQVRSRVVEAALVTDGEPKKSKAKKSKRAPRAA